MNSSNARPSVARNLVAEVENKNPNREEIAERSIAIASDILSDSLRRMRLSERYQSYKMARMMKDEDGKTLTLSLSDQVFRPNTYQRSAKLFRHLVDDYGLADYLPPHERIGMGLAVPFSRIFPGIVMPAMTTFMRHESRRVILSAADKKLLPHLKHRTEQNIRMNINQLGEAVLGEEEAERRLQQLIDRLETPECTYVSVKISAIYSQIKLLAYDHSLDVVKKRLRKLYRVAMDNPFLDENGVERPKFVNLDMEEYHDLDLTCDVFKQVLMEDEFLQLRAGIVLQAYLPDSFPVQKNLTEWAKKRIEAGGAPVKIRIVKGANLAMERVEASLKNWDLATYHTKHDVDANYKRMVVYGCQPENARAVMLGVASHNLFELAHALIQRAIHSVEEYVEFEMLEGMANHQARSMRDLVGTLLLYAPIVRREDFHSAIAYLVRRLDENTSEENFLHDLFGMTPDSESFKNQRDRFKQALEHQNLVDDKPHRRQDRVTQKYTYPVGGPFLNVSDTDWTSPENREWIARLREAAREMDPPKIPLMINGEEIFSGKLQKSDDPSRPETAACHYSEAKAEQVEKALQTATEAQAAWRARPKKERRKLLKKAAQEIAKVRGRCIATMIRDSGKAIPEGDTEVSEAIDFANYYADSLQRQGFFDGTQRTPLGTIVITPPWNFPFAIPCGGILAALMAGNTVIIKPAPETVLTAWELCQPLWAAGIPKDALQFLPCPDNEIGQKLVTDPRTSGVILTGAHDTAQLFQGWKPEINLFAETSGKNSLIITASADSEEAIKDLVHSAFGHAGQKCSAASLAIVEAELYDSPTFRRQLHDAASSLKVGSAWDPSSSVTPTIHPPEGALARAQTELDDDEEWLLEPKADPDNPHLWSPGIKIGVRADSWYRKTECFGPVLGIIRADDLDDAIEIQNNSEYGLTGGIHTLDRHEIAQWRDKVEVGNAYIKRGITGAVVQRQPFGGWKKSSVGPGSKAGGPNYLTLFSTWKEKALPEKQAEASEKIRTHLDAFVTALSEEKERLQASAGSYAYWWQKEFGKEHDPSQLHGEDNHFRYRALPRVILRADHFTETQLAQIILATSTCGNSLEISSSKPIDLLGKIDLSCQVEDEKSFLERLRKAKRSPDLLRSHEPGEELTRLANELSIRHIGRAPLANGRLELLAYLREQSVTETTHRYGNVTKKPSTPQQ